MDSNNIRPSSPNPSTTSSDSGIGVTPAKTGSAFTRTAKAVDPELNQQNLEPSKTPTTKIKDRVPSDLSAGQKLKLGLLRLGAALLSGTKANHWLADKALGLLKSAYFQDQRTVAVKLQGMIDSQLIQLDSQQSESYTEICQNFAQQDEVNDLLGDEEELTFSSIKPRLEFMSDEDEGIDEMDTTSTSSEVLVDKKMPQDVDENLSLTSRLNALYNANRSQEALEIMEKEFFDGASHKALKNPIVKMANSEETPPDGLAAIFNNVVYDVVTDESAPVGERRLEQLRIMLHSTRTLFPDACDYLRAMTKIDKQLMNL